MNDPILAPNLWVNQLEEIGLFEEVAKLGAEENRERLDVNEEAIAGIEPPAIGSESASSGDVVKVRMVEEIARPGVEDADSADLASDEARVGSQLEQGFR